LTAVALVSTAHFSIQELESNMTLSSLQQAARSIQNSKPSSGRFESCFAAGLDLSELQSSDAHKNDGNIASASAALLQAKSRERIAQQQQEVEEHRMNAIIMEKTRQHQERLAAGAKDDDASVLRVAPPSHMSSDSTNLVLPQGGVYSALVGMHRVDTTEVRTNVKKSAHSLHRNQLQHQKLKQRGITQKATPVPRKSKKSKY
jgi:hypothetical protein